MTAVPLSGCMGEEKIQIGAILPQSGNLDDYGPPMLRGVELAAKRVNEKNGGVLGKEVEIASQDSQTESQAANSALQTLINVDGVPAFIGAAGSGVSKTILDTAIDNEVVQISPSNTSPDFTDMEDEGYYWRTCSSDEFNSISKSQC